ncbi:MmgE/PrpD family protein [Rhizobium sp. 16-449-1b]|uniref:MmgE/PrpD family protein n=1 Tax=Rhizobium sp. 16-449-1b TaxID=2819989 RepID=UPI001ADA85A1|nr:MmgE/PrpD family protein [Rhizobium sp. 16-449-1b]MBO9195440.1 MmgE/PrpD family protein [Rhizobium sp. 16-449-1b]
MTEWITKELAEYAVATSFDTYLIEVVEQGKLFVLDTLGCMLGGIQTELSQTMARSLKKAGSGGGATIVGTDISLSLGDAALLNGTSANALDFEETLAGIGHPSGTIFGAALAAGEDREITGAEFLDSVLVGYDIGNRIGRSIQPSYERLQEVWFVGTWQTFSAVSAAAKCLKLDLEKTLHAYGIAGATAPLPNSQKWGFEHEERPVHWVKEPTGWPSWTGITAALLAENGFVGNRFILDGEKGFWRMAGSDRVDFAGMRRNLGTDFEIMNASFKPYSCCRWQHSALDCVTELMGRHKLRAEDIVALEVHTFDWVQGFEIYGPVDSVDAGFSIPFSVTMLLHGFKPGPGWFVNEVLHDRDLIDYSKRITVKLDAYYNTAFHKEGRIGARVEIKLRSGEAISATSDIPTGSPERPMARAAIVDKYMSMAAPMLGEKNATELMHRVADMEHVRKIGDILNLTRVS